MSYMGILGAIPDLNSLSDVSIILPQQNDLLAFNNVTKRWENEDFASLDIHLGDLIDINITNVQNGQVLMWEDNVWVNNYATKADRPFQYFLTSFV